MHVDKAMRGIFCVRILLVLNVYITRGIHTAAVFSHEQLSIHQPANSLIHPANTFKLLGVNIISTHSVNASSVRKQQ